MKIRAVCDACANEFDADQAGAWVEMTGWMIQREKRSAGRTQSIREKKPTGKYLCAPCGKLRSLGVINEQNSLFG